MELETILKKLTSHLDEKQKYVLRNIYNLRFLSPILSDSLSLIFGCQRSGTTLLLLMLQAHLQIQGIDETEFPRRYPFPHSLDLFKNRLSGNIISIKLPMHINKLDYLARYFPKVKILWIIRHPENVIASMYALTNSQGNWISRCGKAELKSLENIFPDIGELDLDNLSNTAIASYIWHYKTLAISRFKARNMSVFDFRYETLLENPRETMGEILDFLGLGWDDRVLNFDKFHDRTRTYAGKTRGDVALDPDRRKPKLQLSDDDLATIKSICQDSMEKYEYSLNGPGS